MIDNIVQRLPNATGVHLPMPPLQGMGEHQKPNYDYAHRDSQTFHKRTDTVIWRTSW